MFKIHEKFKDNNKIIDKTPFKIIKYERSPWFLKLIETGPKRFWIHTADLLES